MRIHNRKGFNLWTGQSWFWFCTFLFFILETFLVKLQRLMMMIISKSWYQLLERMGLQYPNCVFDSLIWICVDKVCNTQNIYLVHCSIYHNYVHLHCKNYEFISIRWWSKLQVWSCQWTIPQLAVNWPCLEIALSALWLKVKIMLNYCVGLWLLTKLANSWIICISLTRISSILLFNGLCFLIFNWIWISHKSVMHSMLREN